MTETFYRLFFALTPPASWLSQVQMLQRELSQHDWSRKIRWTPAQNLHVTLRFIGRCEQQLALSLWRDLTTLIKPAHYDFMPVDVSLFPSRSRPVVLALNLKPVSALIELAADINSICDDAGLDPELNNYRPHMTLGRVPDKLSNSLKSEMTAQLEAAAQMPRPSAASKLQMLHSETRVDGAVYTPLTSRTL